MGPAKSFLLGDSDMCQTLGRYFNPTDVEGLGCACMKCSDVVANSVMRNTAHKQESEKCKCRKTHHTVSGNDEACVSEEPSRYFDPRKVAGKDCQCMNSKQIQAMAAQAAATTTTTEVKNI